MKALVFEAPEKPVVSDVPMPTLKDSEVLVRTSADRHLPFRLRASRRPLHHPDRLSRDARPRMVRRDRRGRQGGQGIQGGRPRRRRVRRAHAGAAASFRLFDERRRSRVFRRRAALAPQAARRHHDKSASLIEPFTCGFYAVLRSGGTNASETVVVSGGGTIGLVTGGRGDRHGRPRHRRRSDRLPPRSRKEARRRRRPRPDVGGNASSGSRTDRRRGADLVVEASGHDASLASVFDYAREEGRVSMVGINIGRKIPVVLGNIQMKNLTVAAASARPASGRRRSASSSEPESICRRSRPTTFRWPRRWKRSSSARTRRSRSRSRSWRPDGCAVSGLAGARSVSSRVKCGDKNTRRRKQIQQRFYSNRLLSCRRMKGGGETQAFAIGVSAAAQTRASLGIGG